jgi:D-alanine-D-alanine ligase
MNAGLTDGVRVLILYNEPVLPADHPDSESERDLLDTVEAVARALGAAHCRVSRLGVSRDPARLLSGLQEYRPSVVFNLFEGLADASDTEAHAAGLLEWLGLPFTGCPHQALCLARTKHVAKRLLQGAGLPTPPFLVVDRLPLPECGLPWPVIVKPATQDASVGLDQGSVVSDPGRLGARVGRLLECYGPPVLVEQFIAGREFNVGLIEAPELHVLPVSEIQFRAQGPGSWPIVTYDAKWKPGTPDYEATPASVPANLEPALAARLADLARQAFRLLGCRDYARVDFRVSAAGEPYILEVNPNPDFGPSAGLARGLRAAGLTYAGFAVQLLRQALARGRPGAV